MSNYGKKTIFITIFCLIVVLVVGEVRVDASPQHLLHDGDVVVGLDILNNGFSVDPYAHVTLNLMFPTNGVINLGNKSVVTLDGDHGCRSGTALVVGTSQGDEATLFGGAGALHHTIDLHGDLQLPVQRRLIIDGVSDITIDGHGNALIFNDASILHVADGRVLTLRNMTINGLKNVENIQGEGTLVLHNTVINIHPQEAWQCDVALGISGLVVIRGGGKFLQSEGKELVTHSFSALHQDHDMIVNDELIVGCCNDNVPSYNYDELTSVQSLLRRPNFKKILSNTEMRSISPATFPQYPSAYSAGTGANQFSNDTVANLAADVATWATSVEKFIITSSNAMLAATRSNSNTLLFLERTDSNAKLFLNRNNSNATLFLTKNISNALLAATRGNSNTLLFLERTDSNAKLFLTKNNSNAILNATNALTQIVANLQQELDTIDHGPNNLHLNGMNVTYTLSMDLFLSSNHLLEFNNSNNLDGGGHTINLAANANGVIQVAANQSVTLSNVVIKNFNESAFQFGSNAQLILGDGTNIELASMQTLAQTWVNAGNVVWNGYDNSLMLVGSGGLVIRDQGILTLQNIRLDGVENNNISCFDPSNTIILKNSKLFLTQDYSFTSGKMTFSQDVLVSGTHTFIYAPTNPASGIDAYSKLFFDIGSIFKLNSTSFTLLETFGMVDSSSHLFLNGSTLYIGGPFGMTLTKGTLLVDHTTSFSFDNEGFVNIGDGTAAHNLTIQILPSAKLKVLGGLVNYFNTD